MISKYKRFLYILGIPVLYALVLRFIFDVDIFRNFLAVMSIGFLIALPFGVGALTIWLSPIERLKSRSYRFFMPWLPVGVFFGLTLLLRIEGWACWLMIMPLFLLFAGLGGMIAGYHRWKKYSQSDKLNISIVLLLPFLLTGIEKQIPIQPTLYTANTWIDIHSSREDIWQHVVRVKEIEKESDHGTLTNFLGFPRPIRAELNYNGVGASRHAIFSKGLVFEEKVTAYSEGQSMHFSIKADPYSIPSTTMDKHVVIGGAYFDVLDGVYDLERLDSNSFRLHLYSDFILHTDFNFYAGWWARLIMRDIQNNILQVIRDRCNH